MGQAGGILAFGITVGFVAGLIFFPGLFGAIIAAIEFLEFQEFMDDFPSLGAGMDSDHFTFS